MGFLNPGLLWFAIGGAIPLIIHLLNRQRYRRVRWAAMRFLLAALRKTRRRRRIENLILLLLRILIMMLLAFAIARPILETSALGSLLDTNTCTLLVIDNSYSMNCRENRSTRLDAARQAAIKLVKETPSTEGDRFIILLSSDHPEVRVSETNKKDKVIEGLREITCADHGSSIYHTLVRVAEILKEVRPDMRREVHLFTDLQRLSWEEPAGTEKFARLIRDLTGEENTAFFLFDAGSDGAENTAIVDLRLEHPALPDTRSETRIAVDLYRFADTPLSSRKVSLYVDNEFLESRPTFVEADTITTVHFNHRFREPGPHLIEARIENDFLPRDDTRFLSIDVRRSLKALLVDGEPAPGFEGETAFLRLILDPSGEGGEFHVETVSAALFNAEEIEKYDFLVLANIGEIDEPRTRRIGEYVRHGGGLFIALGDLVNPETYNALLGEGGADLLPAPLLRAAGDPEKRNPLHLVDINLEHPVFSTFSKKLRSAPFGLIFHRFFGVAPPEKEAPPEAKALFERRVIARFDDPARSPALMERTVGEGRVMLMTTSIDGEWNEGVPGRPPFFVIMNNLGRHLATRPFERRNIHVADSIHAVFPMRLNAGKFRLHMPGGASCDVSARRLPDNDRWFAIEHPSRSDDEGPLKGRRNEGLQEAGPYTLRSPDASGDGGAILAHFACNLSPDSTDPADLQRCEGNLDRIGWEELKARHPGLNKCRLLGTVGRQEEEVDIRPPTGGAWKLLLLLLIGFLTLESILAWLFGRVHR